MAKLVNRTAINRTMALLALVILSGVPCLAAGDPPGGGGGGGGAPAGGGMDNAPSKQAPLKLDSQTPSTLQPQDKLTFSFSRSIPSTTPVAVSVGEVAAAISRPKDKPTNIEATLGAGTPSGQRPVKIRIGDENLDPLEPVTVLPTVSTADMPAGGSIGVVAGNDLVIPLSDTYPKGVKPPTAVSSKALIDSPGPGKPPPVRVADRQIIVKVRDSAAGDYNVELKTDDGAKSLGKPIPVRVVPWWWVWLRAGLMWAALLFLVWVIYKLRYRYAPPPPPNEQPQYVWIKTLLVEPDNNTYSLSRFQFILWSGVLVLCYLVIFFTRGVVDNVWNFPPSASFPFAFLISLGTLVTAQATSTATGTKGAGAKEASVSDLVTHGGVLALERVQQLVWTVIGCAGFLYITYRTYAALRTLPTIPDELFILMGLSSVGYLAGKATRGAGPKIQRVLAEVGKLTIEGEQLSPADRSHLWVDGLEITNKDPFKITSGDSDPKQPNDFVRSLVVTFPPAKDAWLAQPHAVRIANENGQFAEWNGRVRGPKITSVAPVPADAQGHMKIKVRVEGVMPGAALSIDGAAPTDRAAPTTLFAPDPSSPTSGAFAFTVPEAWLQGSHTLVVTNPAPDAQQDVFYWRSSPTLVSVSPPLPNGQGGITFEVVGREMSPETTLTVGELPAGGTVKKDPTDPNRWTVTMQPPGQWTQQPHNLVVTYPLPDGRSAIYRWLPTSPTATPEATGITISIPDPAIQPGAKLMVDQGPQSYDLQRVPPDTGPWVATNITEGADWLRAPHTLVVIKDATKSHYLLPAHTG